MDFFSDPVLLDSFGIFWNILESFKLIFNAAQPGVGRVQVLGSKKKKYKS